MKKLLLLLIPFLFLKLNAQEDKGFLGIKNFGQEDFKSQLQNFIVKESGDHIIYIGNKEGLLEYRGGTWRKHQLPNLNDVTSIEIGPNGVIYVGGVEEFGYFSADTLLDNEYHLNVNLRYISLRDKLDSSIQNIGKIFSIGIHDGHIYYISDHSIFIWDGKTLVVRKSELKYRGIINYKGQLYIKLDQLGLQRIAGENFIQIKGIDKIMLIKETGDLDEQGKPKKIKVPKITAKIPFDAHWDLVYLKNSGFFLFQIKDDKVELKRPKVKPYEFPPYIDVTDVENIGNHNIAVSSSNGGIFILDYNLQLIRIINSKSGLTGNGVNDILFDHQHHLWAAREQGISRIKLEDNIETYEPKNSGYTGIIEAINRFNGDLYLISSSGGGFFKLHKPDQKGLPSSFNKIVDSLVKKPCYDAITFEMMGQKRMVIITYDDVVEMNEKGEFYKISPAIGWKLLQDKMDPARVWVGLDNGLASIYFDGEHFLWEGKVPGVNQQCRRMAQDNDGTLWAGSNLSDVVRIQNIQFVDHKIEKLDIKSFDEQDGLPDDNVINPKLIHGKIVFTTGLGIFNFNDKKSKFELDLRFKKFLNLMDPVKGKQCHRMVEDTDGNIWISSKNTDETRVQIYKLTLKRDSNIYNPLLVYEAKGVGEIFNSIFQDDGHMWFGSVSSLVNFSNLYQNKDIPLFTNHIHLVLGGNDTVFSGFVYYQDSLYTNQPANSISIIPYRNNTITFKYSSLLRNNEEGNSYSYQLEGFDDQWSEWSPRNEERFTNLSEGTYTFNVRVKDKMGNISSTISYRLRIEPPWYRTIWAYISYFLFFVAFVWGAINVSTRSLKKIIREATAEIQEQKDELEEKNQNILDSIHYAKRIQEAVTPKESQMTKYFPEHFVLWRPRDIVSGDFYWMMNKNNKTILAAADCTGHGVPGAFMSIMGISFLNQIANMPEVQNAADALNHLRHNVISSLNTEGSQTDTKDGMDISLCVYDFEEMVMEFSGAYNPLYMVRDGEITVVKADRMPVGVHDRMGNSFTNSKFTMMKGDVYYILSDGYVDQFGGPKGKKFMTKRFKNLILDIHKLPMAEQSRLLEEELLKWRGDIEQVDDIIIIGVRIV